LLLQVAGNQILEIIFWEVFTLIIEKFQMYS
jgi:hypothetical protein